MKAIKAIYKKDLERLQSEHKEMKEALKYAYKLLLDQAEKGRYPDLALQENGGKGFHPITSILKKIKS